MPLRAPSILHHPTPIKSSCYHCRFAAIRLAISACTTPHFLTHAIASGIYCPFVDDSLFVRAYGQILLPRSLVGGDGDNRLARPVDDVVLVAPGPVSVGVVCPGEPSAAVVLVDVAGSHGHDVLVLLLGVLLRPSINFFALARACPLLLLPVSLAVIVPIGTR